MKRYVKENKVDFIWFWKVILVGVFILINSKNVMTDELLEAPRPLALPGYIEVLLPDRECNHTYRLERSLDQKNWSTVGTYEAYINSMIDPAQRQCANDALDNVEISRETQAVYYRYMEIEGNRIVHISEVGKMDMFNDKDAADYWGE